jgi:hypothetical protein
MIALLFIIVITGLSVLISILIGPKGPDSWFKVYIGGIVGLVISGIVLGIINKRKRAKELKEAQSNINPLYKKKKY